MNSENRVSIVFSDDDVKDIQMAVDILNKKLLPRLIKIDANERRMLPKMGDKTVAFVTKANEFAINNPSLVPQFIDVNETEKDINLVKVLRTIAGPIDTISDMLNDTMLVAGSEAYCSTLAFYSSVKFASRMNQPGAEIIANELKRQFPKPANSKEPDNIAS
jgi:hypothetical protein